MNRRILSWLFGTLLTLPIFGVNQSFAVKNINENHEIIIVDNENPEDLEEEGAHLFDHEQPKSGLKSMVQNHPLATAAVTTGGVAGIGVVFCWLLDNF